jgi:membrane associated rhomboid family serine protease
VLPIGSSGAIFCIIFLFLMLLPRAVVTFGYAALFPFTLLTGLVSRPRHWVFWFLRRDTFDVPAWAGLFLVPLLELWGLIWQRSWGNLGHLLGLLCGVVVILLLPSDITMRRRPAPGGV